MFTTLQDAVVADSHLCLIRGHGVSISFHFISEYKQFYTGHKLLLIRSLCKVWNSEYL